MEPNQDHASTVSGRSKANIDNSSVNKDGKTLRRNLTYLNVCSFVVIDFLGSGMFVSPSLVARQSPNMFVAIIVWIMAGGCALLGALCYCELATTLKKTGSSYIFVLDCYGETPAFIIIWANIFIIAPFSNGIVAYIAGSHICDLFIQDQSSSSFIWYSKLVAIFLFYFSIVMNIYGAKASGNVQKILLTIQGALVLLILSLGVYHASVTKSADNLSPYVMFNNTWSGVAEDIPALGSAMFNALWCFASFYMISQFVEEIMDPTRNIPLLTFTTIPAVILVYIALNVAFLMVLSQQELASSAIVLTNVAKIVAGKNFAYVIPVFVTVACVGTLITVCYQLPRIVMSAAREGQLPAILGLIHKTRRTPIPAILLTAVSGTVMIIFAEYLEAVIHIINIALYIQYPLVFSTIIVSRFTKPHADCPYKVWITTPLFMICVSLLLLISSFINNPLSTGIVTLFILLGIPFHYVCVRRNWLSFLKLDVMCRKLMLYTPLVLCEIENNETSV